MATAIYFPQPIDLEEITNLPMLDPPAPSRRRVKRVAAGLVLAVTVGLVVVSMARPTTDHRLSVAAAGSAEMALREMVRSTGDRYVAFTGVVSAVQQGDLWVVTIAADLLGLTEGGYVPTGIHFFQVELGQHESGWVVVGGPAEVAGPATAMSHLTPLASATESPVTNAIRDYLDWLLTGAPGSYDAERPNPAPYRSVEIAGMASMADESGTINRVDVRAIDRLGHPMDLSYRLRVINVQGSWIVVPDS
jgi:hypothetical protein